MATSLVKNSLVYACKVAVDNFILVSLSVAVIFAFSYPPPGTLVDKVHVNSFKGLVAFINNVLVFLLSGIALRVEDLRSLWSSKWLILYGLIVINVLTTLICFMTVRLPFPTVEYSLGLTVLCSVPTTLGVGVVLTGEAKGDKLLALFLTISSNMLGILTIPYLLSIYLKDGNDADALSTSSGLKIDPRTLAFKLTLTVLIPTITGMLCRAFVPGVAEFATTRKKELSMFSMVNLMMIVWMSLSSAKPVIFQQKASEIIILFFVAMSIHLLFLCYNAFTMFACRRFVRLDKMIATTIMCSQKSSPVALSVIIVIASTSAQRGLMTIPCILGQVGQILVGSILAPRIANYYNKQELKTDTTNVEENKEREDVEKQDEQQEQQQQELELVQ